MVIISSSSSGIGIAISKTETFTDLSVPRFHRHPLRGGHRRVCLGPLLRRQHVPAGRPGHLPLPLPAGPVGPALPAGRGRVRLPALRQRRVLHQRTAAGHVQLRVPPGVHGAHVRGRAGPVPGRALLQRRAVQPEPAGQLPLCLPCRLPRWVGLLSVFRECSLVHNATITTSTTTTTTSNIIKREEGREKQTDRNRDRQTDRQTQKDGKFQPFP